MKSNIDQFFQDKLKDFQYPPSQEAWNTLENQLQESKINKKTKAWKWISAAASILLFLIGGYQFYYSSNPTQSNIALKPLKDTLTIYTPLTEKINTPYYSKRAKNQIHKNKSTIHNDSISRLLAQTHDTTTQDATFTPDSSSSTKKSVTIEITIQQKNYVSMDKQKKKWITNTIRFLTRLKKAEVEWNKLSLKDKNNNEKLEK